MSGLTLTDKMAQMLFKCSRGRVQMRKRPSRPSGWAQAFSKRSTINVEFSVHSLSGVSHVLRTTQDVQTVHTYWRHPSSTGALAKCVGGVTTSNDECLTSIHHGFGSIYKVNKRVDMNIQVSRIEFKAATPACLLL